MPRKKSDLSEGDGRTVQVRFPADLLAAVDREVERIALERGGEPVTRSEVIRIVLRRALMAEQQPKARKGTKR